MKTGRLEFSNMAEQRYDVRRCRLTHFLICWVCFVGLTRPTQTRKYHGFFLSIQSIYKSWSRDLFQTWLNMANVDKYKYMLVAWKRTHLCHYSTLQHYPSLHPYPAPSSRKSQQQKRWITLYKLGLMKLYLQRDIIKKRKRSKTYNQLSLQICHSAMYILLMHIIK